jgi:small multidrug resistance pump
MQWLYLAIAIVSEVVATSALKASDGFSQLIPLLVVIVGYGLSFYFLALTLRTMPIGVAYAVWSGAGVVLLSLIGWTVYRQRLGVLEIIGIAFIVLGVLILNLFSRPVH